jgi:uncharacterized protein
MRRDVTFLSKGLKCAGWLFVPDDLAPRQKAPAVVMGHGFGGIKELYLANYAEPFAEAGFVTLAFDYRYTGESEGEPRCQQLPWDNQEDYRNAISWLSLQPEVDPDRIGIWGTSYSGAHVIQVAAFDKRVKAVVNQANGTLSSLEAFGSMMGREGMNGMLGMMLQARVATYESGAVAYVPFVAPPGEPAAVNMPRGLRVLHKGPGHGGSHLGEPNLHGDDGEDDGGRPHHRPHPGVPGTHPGGPVRPGRAGPGGLGPR